MQVLPMEGKYNHGIKLVYHIVITIQPPLFPLLFLLQSLPGIWIMPTLK